MTIISPKRPLALLAVAALLFGAPLQGAPGHLPGTLEVQSTAYTGAGSAKYPADATFATLKLDALKFGMAVEVPGDGSATGTFAGTLVATTLTGQPRSIVMDVDARTGSLAADGATIAGVGTLNMGDGTATQADVPFTVSVKMSNGSTTLTLTVAGTTLPVATVNQGGVTAK